MEYDSTEYLAQDSYFRVKSHERKIYKNDGETMHVLIGTVQAIEITHLFEFCAGLNHP